MSEHLILRVVIKFLIPFIFLFALYVQAHGDYGPGGGFQAGIIFSAGFILYGMIFGLHQLRRVVPPHLILALIAFGLLLYTGVGFATILLGGTFLDYGYLSHDTVHGHHYGIFLIELGVGITVASVMIAIYQTFTARAEETTDENVGTG